MRNQVRFCSTTLAAALLSITMNITAAGQQMAVSHTPTRVTSQPDIAAGRPVARVNGRVLTELDLEREEYTLFPYAAQHNGQIPPELAPQIRQGALKMIEFEELLYQEALRKQVTIPPTKLEKAEADLRAQFNGEGEYKAFLVQQFQGSEKKLQEKIRRSLLIDAMLKTEVTDRSAVSVAEARAYYDKNPERFQFPEAFAFQTISFLPPKQATLENLKELRKRAEEGLRQAKAATTYEQFGMLAEKISEDDYRVMMGDHHKVDRTKLSPEVVQAMLALKPGEITGIIPIEQAYTIVRLNQHILPGKLRFEDAKPALMKELQQKKTERIRASLDRQLRKTAKVEEL
jgi:parvulin-like peptidyl-prolyl isomerase